MRFFSKLFAILFAFYFILLGSAQAQTTASFAVLLRPNEQLVPDQKYFSPNGRYFVVFQGFDGNLVVYRGSERSAQGVIWAAGDRHGTTAIFQWDANFVIYKGAITPPNAVWASNSEMTPNTNQQPFLGINNDGSLFVAGYGGGVRWQSRSDPSYTSGTCTTARQYPICVFPGTYNAFNSFVLACSVAEAQQQAAATGATYGACW